jgi:hypothetical protein
MVNATSVYRNPLVRGACNAVPGSSPSNGTFGVVNWVQPPGLTARQYQSMHISIDNWKTIGLGLSLFYNYGQVNESS